MKKKFNNTHTKKKIFFHQYEQPFVFALLLFPFSYFSMLNELLTSKTNAKEKQLADDEDKQTRGRKKLWEEKKKKKTKISKKGKKKKEETEEEKEYEREKRR